MLVNRLNWWLETGSKFPPSQFDFRKQRSYIDNLSILYAEIMKAFQNNTAISAAFLNVQSTYDNVLADILDSKLRQVDILVYTRHFVYSLLFSRRLTLCYGSINETRLVSRGLPAGKYFELSSLHFICG